MYSVVFRVSGFGLLASSASSPSDSVCVRAGGMGLAQQNWCVVERQRAAELQLFTGLFFSFFLF
jgi:hypothetical protein